MKDVLTAKGINPKVAAFVPQDLDASEEAVTNWLNEYGDVFGVKSDEESESKSASNNPALQAQARINDVVSTGTPPGMDEDMYARMANVKNAAELNALLGISVN